MCRTKNIPISGPMMKQFALKVAEKIGIQHSASDGWLHNLQSRCNINFKQLSGESADVNITLTGLSICHFFVLIIQHTTFLIVMKLVCFSANFRLSHSWRKVSHATMER